LDSANDRVVCLMMDVCGDLKEFRNVLHIHLCTLNRLIDEQTDIRQTDI